MKKRPEGEALPGMPQEILEEKPEIPNNWIDEMVGALTDPLIVFPSPWNDTLPAWIKEQLSMARLIHVMKCSKGMAQWDECCDLEVLAYMYGPTLDHPLDHDFSEIYIYVGYKVMYEQGMGLVKKEDFPEDLKMERGLTKDQERGLRDLKRFIQRKKVQVRQERRRGVKMEEKARVQEEAEAMIEDHERPTLFDI